MKKIISLISAVLIVAVLFTGCNNNSKADDVNLKEMLSKINKDFSITGVTEITETDKLELYYSISPEDVKQFAAEYVTNNTGDPIEIVLIEAVNDEARERVELALVNRFNSQSAQSGSYNANASAIFAKCGVNSNGNFVNMIVSEYVEEITKLYNSYFN